MACRKNSERLRDFVSSVEYTRPRGSNFQEIKSWTSFIYAKKISSIMSKEVRYLGLVWNSNLEGAIHRQKANGTIHVFHLGFFVAKWITRGYLSLINYSYVSNHFHALSSEQRYKIVNHCSFINVIFSIKVFNALTDELFEFTRW